MSRLLLERHVFQLNFYLIFLFKDFEYIKILLSSNVSHEITKNVRN